MVAVAAADWGAKLAVLAAPDRGVLYNERIDDFKSLCLDVPGSADEGVSGREWAGVTGAEDDCLITSSLAVAKKSAPWSCCAGDDELEARWVVDGEPRKASRLVKSDEGLALAATGEASAGLATCGLLLVCNSNVSI